MAIVSSGESFELREILLKDKPNLMLQFSPKGTVPVAVINDKLVIDESLELMLWALAKNDPQNWLTNLDDSLEFIFRNDEEFKYWLDRYKYHVGYPEYSQEYYRGRAVEFLTEIEGALSKHDFLFGRSPSLADMAIFPFVRQFAFVDKCWFDQCEFSQTKQWLDYWLNNALYEAVMKKYQVWDPISAPQQFPEKSN